MTHTFVIGWIVREVMDAPWWKWIRLNHGHGAVTVVRWTDGESAELLSYNERNHLREIDGHQS